ncbi:hypothetical protein [Aliikangiella sp. G2MR2-5]|uniref:hypothetical protein n=1 Tax=Aliikangiella sp. G2MR2-5 TaxID=2788943 RepID=UPI0018AAF4F3|nr:hypothetical protein [Aliikangiella sp. G2MR2-5]
MRTCKKAALIAAMIITTPGYAAQPNNSGHSESDERHSVPSGEEEQAAMVSNKSKETVEMDEAFLSFLADSAQLDDEMTDPLDMMDIDEELMPAEASLLESAKEEK